MKRQRDSDLGGGPESVPRALLQSTMLYYANEPLIQQCRTVLAAELFPAGWHLAWRDASPSARGPRALNAPPLKAALELFLLTALDHLLVHGFVALWTHRDLAHWLRSVSDAPDVPTLDTIGLPFGVLPFDQLGLAVETPPNAPFERRYIVPEGTLDDRAQRRYTTLVFTHRLALQPVSPEELAQAQEYVQAKTGRRYGAELSEAWTGQLRRPASAVYELMRRRAETDEAERNLFDADWQRAHPRMFLATHPPNAAAVAPEMLGNDALYSAADLWTAANNKLREQQHFTLASASAYIDRMRSRMRNMIDVSSSGSGGAQTLREQAKQHYRRPESFDDAVPLPEYVAVAHAPAADVLQDVRVLEQVYRRDVLAFMGVPEAALTRGSFAGSGRTDRVEDKSQQHVLFYLEKTVEDMRHLLTTVFNTVWMATFGVYETAAIERRLALIDAAADDDDDDDDAEGAEERLTTLKAHRQWLQEVKARRRLFAEPDVVLRTQRVGSLQQMDAFATQIKLFDRGLVAVPDLERAARAALGPQVRLREPPVVDGEGAAGAAAKKPRKAPGEKLAQVEQSPLTLVLEDV